MRTLLANMKHAARQSYVTPIGGGTFSPAELPVADKARAILTRMEAD